MELGVSAELGHCYSGHGDGNPLPALPYVQTRTTPSTKASLQARPALGTGDASPSRPSFGGRGKLKKPNPPRRGGGRRRSVAGRVHGVPSRRGGSREVARSLKGRRSPGGVYGRVLPFDPVKGDPREDAVPGMDVKRPRGAPSRGFSRAVKGKGPKKTPARRIRPPSARDEGREGTPPEGVRRSKESVTRLILTVVVCSSPRLSHASPSTRP